MTEVHTGAGSPADAVVAREGRIPLEVQKALARWSGDVCPSSGGLRLYVARLFSRRPLGRNSIWRERRSSGSSHNNGYAGIH